ncbi:Putative glycine--tRNA ligase [Cladobotryum mycophilum]|uniref:Glycine--tRNA ligase n=1 Tax=Cladobotryum mycophilum TaxID=491253 RepID=A0ABR0S6H0_9HYPO
MDPFGFTLVTLTRFIASFIRDMADTTDLKGAAFSRQNFESLLKRRFFFAEAFGIYRTSANFKSDNRGLFDYGPPGCALQTNIVNE